VIRLLSLHSKVSLKDELLFADLDMGEAAILSLKDGIYYGFDPVAARMVHFFKENKNVTEVRDALLNEFRVEEGQLTFDLVELIERLVVLGLVDVR
jgi:Coenzyme PQQ synthesis protein D (PqqD)